MNNYTMEKPFVIIVDDNIADGELLVAALKNNFKVKLITNSEEALNVLLSIGTMPDLILLDIMMHGIDGFEVCKKIKLRHGTKNIPVIFISNESSIEQEVKAFEHGAADYFVKPVILPLLQLKIAKHLQMKQKIDELVEYCQLNIIDMSSIIKINESKSDKPSVMVVDDDLSCSAILTEVLQNECDVLAVDSAEKALQLLSCENQPDLILLDILMQGMDGFELFDIILSNQASKSIPVIFITNCAMIEQQLKGLQKGAVDFITKPLIIPIIKIKIHNFLSLQRKFALIDKCDENKLIEI